MMPLQILANHLSAYITWIHFFLKICLHPFFLCYKIAWTGNTLDAGNDAPTNIFKQFGCIKYLCTVCNKLKLIILRWYKKSWKCDNTHFSKKNFLNFGFKLDADISIWMQSRYDKYEFSARLLTWFSKSSIMFVFIVNLLLISFSIM